MKINSTTFTLEKESYSELESILKKIASDNNIEDVAGISINISEDGGILKFAISEPPGEFKSDGDHYPDYVTDDGRSHFDDTWEVLNEWALKVTDFKDDAEDIDGQAFYSHDISFSINELPRRIYDVMVDGKSDQEGLTEFFNNEKSKENIKLLITDELGSDMGEYSEEPIEISNVKRPDTGENVYISFDLSWRSQGELEQYDVSDDILDAQHDRDYGRY